MSEEAQAAADQRELPRLKYPEADVSPEEPWQDDVLDRAKIAEKLTNLLRNQRDPFVISIDGYWGTGKTFLLKRWQMDLEAEGFKAIYYNAWEDDFCDDPLLAIVGQLSEQFKEDAFREIAKKAGEVAVRLIWKNVKAVIERQTGLVLDLDLGEQKGRDLSPGVSRPARDQRSPESGIDEAVCRGRRGDGAPAGLHHRRA